MTKPDKSSDPAPADSTQRADAEFFKVTPRTVRNWRDAGAPGFRADGTVEDRDALAAWVAKEEERRKGAARGIEAERDQKIRKLKLANDRAEGRLIERLAVASRMQLAAGELNSFRAKSEAEHPMKFAAAAGDPAKCREIVRGIWDEIFGIHVSMAKHFADPKPPAP
jgi:hypothetical protein